MLGSAIDVNPFMNGLFLFGKPLPRQYRIKPANPGYNWYRCRDGKWIATALPVERSWSVLCEALGLAEWGNDPKYDSLMKRSQHSEEITAKFDQVFTTKDYSEWAEILRAADLNFAPVNDFSDLLTDEQVIANDYIIERDHPFFSTAKYSGFPIKFGNTEQSITRTAPVIGQHTEEVLLEIGYTWEEIGELKDKEVI
jgi:crotonobetainyl-CoA:carnitine CoA-transferase CaiB-like acyl-CoA transferase